MGADRKYTGTSCYDSSTIAPPKGLVAFAGEVDPLATKIIGIAREAAENVGTDTAWALTCLQNSVNVRRRPA